MELKGTKGRIIALISTVATPGLDSDIRFYDTDWNPLPTENYFTKPGWKEWLTESGSKNEADVTIDPSTSTLTLTNNLDKLLDKALYDDISSDLMPSLTYEWTGKAFKAKK